MNLKNLKNVKQRKMKGAAVLVSMAAVPLVFMATAFADTNSFDTQYQGNLTQEQTLLTTAQTGAANSTDSNVLGLLTSVQNINAQISSLYTVEQALVSGASSIPQVHATHPQEQKQLKDLQTQRAKLLKQLNDAWKLVSQYAHHPHRKGLLKKAIADHTRMSNDLKALNQKIATLDKKLHEQDWQGHPYDGGKAVLQDSILKLQAAAIHYTNVAITLEQSGSNTSAAPISTNGLPSSSLPSTSSSGTGSTTTGN